MLILLHIILMFLFTFYSGYGLTRLASQRLNLDTRWGMSIITPTIGFVLSQVLFFFWYWIFENAKFSFYTVIITVSIINLFYLFLYQNKHSFNFSIIKKIDKLLIFTSFLIFVLSSWQYILIGQGNYFHSGNEDYFDGINGGNAYLIDTPLRYIFYNIAGGVQFTAVIKLQYSSQAFVRLLLNVGALDGFMLQQIFCLIITFLGVYWLAKYVFVFSRITSLLISFWSVAGSFYFSTFMTGHIGSIMYVSAVPVFLGLFLLWGRKEIGWEWLILLVIMFYFFDNTYPGPIYYLLIPILIVIVNERLMLPYKLWDKFFAGLGFSKQNISFSKLNELKFLRITILLLLIAVIFFIAIEFLWNFFEAYRLRALTRSNVSWKITLYKEMLMVFWGIYPPGSTGTSSILPLFISNKTINTISFIISVIITILAILPLYSITKHKERAFIFVYGILLIPYFILMRYFWGSPYYIYKFLYVHIFLVIILLHLAVIEYYPKINLNIRKIIFSFFIFLGAINIIWDISLGLDFYYRPYHNKEKVKDFVKNVPKEVLAKSYVDIPREVDNLVFKWVLSEMGVGFKPNRKDAHYLIQLKNVGNATYNSVDIKKEIYNNGLISIIEKPKINDLTISSQYEPNFANGLNINWIGNSLSLYYNLYRKSIEEIIGHIKKNGQNKLVYIDILEPDLYMMFTKILPDHQIKISGDHRNTDWFLRRRDGISNFISTGFESNVFSNELFSIDYVPVRGRKINPIIESNNLSEFVSFIKKNGNSVYLDIPHHESLYYIIESTLSTNNIDIKQSPSEAELFLRFIINPPYDQYTYLSVKGESENQIGTLINSSNLKNRYWDIELVKIKKENRKLFTNPIKTFIPYRILTSGYDSDFILSIDNVSDKARYLRVILSPGPSIDYKDFVLSVKDGNKFIKKYIISAPNTLIDIPLDECEKDNGNLTLTFTGENLIGKSLLPIEERYLNYMILGVELVEKTDTYSSTMLKIMGHRPLSNYSYIYSRYFQARSEEDVIDKGDQTRLALGLGWYGLEKVESNPMRWVGQKSSEIIINKTILEDSKLHIELEPGPGCGGKPLNLNILFNNKLIAKEEIVRRENLLIDLSNLSSEYLLEQNIIKLIPITDNVKIANDPRVLNFRVFSISMDNKYYNDIVDTTIFRSISLAGDWHQFEEYNNEKFRWVGKNPAGIHINYRNISKHILIVDLESGPGCGKKPLELDIIFNGKLIKKEKLRGRRILQIDFSKISMEQIKEQNIIKLVPKTENLKTPNDPRVLNFRVFNIRFILNN